MTPFVLVIVIVPKMKVNSVVEYITKSYLSIVFPYSPWFSNRGSVAGLYRSHGLLCIWGARSDVTISNTILGLPPYSTSQMTSFKKIDITPTPTHDTTP